MLEELKKYKEIGEKNEVTLLLCNIIGNHSLTIDDIKVICENSKYIIRHTEALITLLNMINIIEKDNLNNYKISSDINLILFENDKLINKIIERIIERLFYENLLLEGLFEFNTEFNAYKFKKEVFPLGYSSIRNFLASLGFFSRIYNQNQFNITFYVNGNYESLLIKYLKANKKNMKLEQLKKKLEDNEKAGEMAEEYVLEYERQRLGANISNEIKQVSIIDVTAGYDIASFDSILSKTYDRFIEVKAISSDNTFYWSKGEINSALIKQDKYFLYLIDLKQINNSNYQPNIVKNPADIILEDSEWSLEPQSYLVKKVL
ncbi:DUF3883 domain-containing protein [Sedimentibacter saalensis]|uniref:DUF3883 domain-containing protein n=1 Tax=Sedimentibacter saalensis TaxID=130788 RepID=UPI00289B4B32|nr:DUF3883 domain-containing protein [Sedimentibacter saalensis]